MPNFKHAMLDLETLSKRPNACIIQISARAFDIETGELGPSFNAYVNESSLVGAKVGHIDVGTVAWWMQQAPAAVLGSKINDEDECVPLGVALCDFEEWYLALAGEDAETGDDAVAELRLWCKGLSFDFPILASAFARCDLEPVPWHHRSPRDMRSLFDLTPGGQPDLPKDETRKHDAQYDCEYQIAQVCAAWAALRRQAELAQNAIDLEAMALDPRPAADAEYVSVARDPISDTRGL